MAVTVIRLEARRIVLAGALRAQTVSLRADEVLDLETTADIAATDVRLQGHLADEEEPGLSYRPAGKSAPDLTFMGTE